MESQIAYMMIVDSQAQLVKDSSGPIRLTLRRAYLLMTFQLICCIESLEIVSSLNGDSQHYANGRA